MKLPKKIPNLNQIIFNGSSILEFINPSSKNIKEIISSQTLILLPLKSGNNEMIKKTKKTLNQNYDLMRALYFYSLFNVGFSK